MIVAGPVTLLSFDSTISKHDSVGNVTVITETNNSGQAQNFAYDALNRLIDASTSGGGARTYDIEYGYDAVGNIAI